MQEVEIIIDNNEKSYDANDMFSVLKEISRKKGTFYDSLKEEKKRKNKDEILIKWSMKRERLEEGDIMVKVDKFPRLLFELKVKGDIVNSIKSNGFTEQKRKLGIKAVSIPTFLVFVQPDYVKEKNYIESMITTACKGFFRGYGKGGNENGVIYTQYLHNISFLPYYLHQMIHMMILGPPSQELTQNEYQDSNVRSIKKAGKSSKGLLVSVVKNFSGVTQVKKGIYCNHFKSLYDLVKKAKDPKFLLYLNDELPSDETRISKEKSAEISEYILGLDEKKEEKD